MTHRHRQLQPCGIHELRDPHGGSEVVGKGLLGEDVSVRRDGGPDHSFVVGRRDDDDDEVAFAGRQGGVNGGEAIVWPQTQAILRQVEAGRVHVNGGDRPDQPA